MIRSSVRGGRSGDEFGPSEDVRHLGRKAEAWSRKNLVGTVVTNARTGMVIPFNATGAERMAGSKGDFLDRAVVGLRDVLAKGRHVNSEQDCRDRPHVKAVHRFRATIERAGAPKSL